MQTWMYFLIPFALGAGAFGITSVGKAFLASRRSSLPKLKWLNQAKDLPKPIGLGAIDQSVEQGKILRGVFTAFQGGNTCNSPTLQKSQFVTYNPCGEIPLPAVDNYKITESRNKWELGCISAIELKERPNPNSLVIKVYKSDVWVQKSTELIDGTMAFESSIAGFTPDVRIELAIFDRATNTLRLSWSRPPTDELVVFRYTACPVKSPEPIKAEPVQATAPVEKDWYNCLVQDKGDAEKVVAESGVKGKLSVGSEEFTVSNEISKVASGTTPKSVFFLQVKHGQLLATSLVGTVFLHGTPIQSFICLSSGVLIFTDSKTSYFVTKGHIDFITREITLEWNVTSHRILNHIAVSYKCLNRTLEEKTEAPKNQQYITQPEWYALVKTLKRHNSSGETGPDDFLKLDTGNTTVRFLPTIGGVEKIYVARRQHYVSTGTVLQCGKHRHASGSWEGSCEICDHYKSLWKRSEECVSSIKGKELQTEARQIKPVERYYYNVLHNGKVKILACGKALHDQIESQIIAIGIDMFNPVIGCNATIRKELIQTNGASYPSYTINFQRNPSRIGTTEYVKEIMEKTYDLEAMAGRFHKTSDELKAAVSKLRGPEMLAWEIYDKRHQATIAAAVEKFPAPVAKAFPEQLKGTHKEIEDRLLKEREEQRKKALESIADFSARMKVSEERQKTLQSIADFSASMKVSAANVREQILAAANVKSEEVSEKEFLDALEKLR